MVDRTDAEALLLIEKHQQWFNMKTSHNWELPTRAPLFFRLPIIRHVRTIYNSWKIAAWERTWQSVGLVPTGYDSWVLYAMWRGWV